MGVPTRAGTPHLGDQQNFRAIANALSALATAVRQNSSRAVSFFRPLRQPSLAQQFLHALHVRRNIHAYRVMLYFRYTNLPAILHPPQLFELLNFLEVSLRQRWILQQRVPLENIES